MDLGASLINGLDGNPVNVLFRQAASKRAREDEARTHTRTHAHTHTHIHTHTYTHTYAHTHAHTRTQARELRVALGEEEQKLRNILHFVADECPIYDRDGQPLDPDEDAKVMITLMTVLMNVQMTCNNGRNDDGDNDQS